MHACAINGVIVGLSLFSFAIILPWQMPGLPDLFHRPCSITFISFPTFIRYSAISRVSKGISSLPRLIHQFTRDIASCLSELLTFKECCGLDTCGSGFKRITCGATHVFKGYIISWLLLIN